MSLARQIGRKRALAHRKHLAKCKQCREFFISALSDDAAIFTETSVADASEAIANVANAAAAVTKSMCDEGRRLLTAAGGKV